MANELSGARSAYLRSAREQPVWWMEWGEAAFQRARAEAKPVLLDIGAVWCHWCHVMDRESYEDAETARLINEHFVAVKVDRDERPDVDARYQAAVAAISGGGGWPLTAFLTAEGKPFFGGTYFPPVDGHGRPGLRRVLMTMAEAYEQKRGEVEETAESVMAAVEGNETFDGFAALAGPTAGETLVGKIVAAAVGQFDARHGGFGAQPKFPNAGALDLLMDAAGRGGADAERSRRVALVTLEKMSRGGIYDQLAGGFHRYSVDERWVVPHFEKMSYDNSELLKAYVHGFQSFGEPECARVAREIVAWVDATLSDRDRGGFYASQDADASLEDDGDYWTWTRGEAAAVLTPEEMRVAGLWFDIGEIGDMHHNAEKNVLHVTMPLPDVARQAGVRVEEAAELVRSARVKLLAARGLRRAPFVDRTVYVGWNAMMVSAYLAAGRVLGMREAVEFALKTLDRVLDAAWDGTAMGHVVAYGESAAAGGVAGVLDDYVLTVVACLDAWEATGKMRYFRAALGIAEVMLERFPDEEKGGFFDTAMDATDRLGALSARRKPVQDAPTPAGNAVAAMLLLRLAELTGRQDFREKARATLECFAAVVEHLGLYAASYGLALRRLSGPAVQVVVVGADATADELEVAGLYRYAAGKTVVRLRSVGEDLPPALAQTVGLTTGKQGSFAMVCSGSVCQAPVSSAEDLVAVLRRL